MNRIFEIISDKLNIAYAVVAVSMTAIFGDYWFLFASFLWLNIIDYITGILKAKYSNQLNSVAGAQGIIRKVGYWITISIAFYISLVFVKMGDLLGINLNFVLGFGWLTLATFILNEIRSILENLVAIGVPVPKFLTKGLKIITENIESEDKEDEDKL